ncbi:hypothetical protein [Sagittula stellata]|uniref:Bacteriophage tail tape measure N-terminal domain-containing protein n=1 Tax=Sagittula stellata (strain ATCC 700073 / DSM 11524 / E-37) TaxID=388399 RepID=A3K205_SAGS3|nr:hypothetical protein [Sagittula stellata]EBA08951.1 hypothetical protein SSE37_04875 [Sagittula stellata E-37]
MTQRKVTYRAELEGGARVKSEFRGIGQAGKEAHERIDTSSKSAARSAEVFERRIRAEERSFRALKASVDPAYAAQIRYAGAEAQVARAVALGVVSKREAAQVLKQMEVRTRATASAMELMDSATVRSHHGLRNALLQVNQIGQQATATGNLMGAVAIQLPDILAGFGGIAPLVIGAAAGLATAFLPNLMKSGDAAKDLKIRLQEAYGAARTALEEAAEAQRRYNAAILLSKTNQDIVTPSILRSLSLEARAREALARLEEAKLERQRRDVEASLAADRAALDTQLADALLQVERIAELRAEAMNQPAGDLGSQATYTALERDRLAVVRQVLGANEDLVLSIREQQAQLDLVNAQLSRGGDEAVDLVDALLEASKNGETLGKTDVGAGIRSAVDESIALVRNLGMGLDLARGIASWGPQGMPGTAPPQGGRGGDPRAMGGSFYDWQTRDAAQFLENWTPPKAARAARGGRGQSAALKEQNRLMQEAARMTEANQTALERYNAEVARANMLREKGLIGSVTHNRELARLKVNLDKATEAQRQLMGIAQPVKDALVNALMGQKNAADQLRVALKRAAIEYALFGTGGFARKGSGFKGLLGNVVSSVFSFDGGGYTPPGPRSGGLDGKGGFMAVMHPNERVDDLTRPGAGQGGGGRVEVAVRMDGSGALVPVIERVSGNVTARMLGAGMQSLQRGFSGQLDAVQARGTS